MRRPFAIALLAVVGLWAVWFTLAAAPRSAAINQEYPDLARGFLSGSLALAPYPAAAYRWIDVAPSDAGVFLPFGPLPALLFAPIVLAGTWPVPIHLVTLPLFGLAAFLVFRSARARGFDARNAGWLAAAYAVGSCFLQLAFGLSSSSVSLLVANVFLLAAFHEWAGRRRPWMIGIALAAAFLCRFASPLGLTAFFILTMTLRNSVITEFRSVVLRERVRWLAGVGIPLLAAAAIFGMYNHARFGSAFETGYRAQFAQFYPARPPWESQLEAYERYGTTSLRHAPRNLGYLLWAPPAVTAEPPFVKPNLLGVGLLFTSPYLLYAIRARWKDREVRMAALAATLGLLPALLFWASGFLQIGYRYAFDVYPLLFLVMLASAFKDGVPRGAKALILASAAANIAWVLSYPL